MVDAQSDIPEALLEVELERLAASPVFRRSPRQVRLLRYLVAGVRAGHAMRLKESTVAVRAATAEARDAYDRSRYLIRLETLDGYRRALPLLQRALAADPRFALGHCAMARALVNLVGVTASTAQESIAEARGFVARALELDPDLGEAHTVQAFITFAFDHDWSSTERATCAGSDSRPACLLRTVPMGGA